MEAHAVIVVDLQKDYLVTGDMALVGIEQAVTNAARVIERSRQLGHVVINVQHEFESQDAPFFRPGTQGVEFIEAVLPADGEPVVVKHSPNSFQGTNLKQLLDEHGVKTVTVVGAMSHMCIDATVRAAADFGYQVTVVHDACATRDLEFQGNVIAATQVHQAFMSALGFAYAKVVTTDEYLAG
ncbi:cysteine hydrolase [Pseudomonas sp. CDFA 602]|uniref:cysteine hydrolase family protein n=1 Tax=Pseudomonas californiensis TaxID=2829823 RepID=UPI001E594B0A|nr:cysteine hydrolase family protein [Pseudomonas californiensis]MCD5996361.1 cysteine hydrolase [Pseudomonas californiensis]MCD6001960.1 cysteine hydrolase [Pseudomonas californiensis]